MNTMGYGNCPVTLFSLSNHRATTKTNFPVMDNWYLYIIEKSGKFYVGITTDLKHRLTQHGNPELLYQKGPIDKHAAAKRERELKGWSRKKKLELIEGRR